MPVTYVPSGQSRMLRREARATRCGEELLVAVETAAECPVCGDQMTVRVAVSVVRSFARLGANGVYLARCHSGECMHSHVGKTKLIVVEGAPHGQFESKLADSVIAEAVSRAECPKWELLRAATAEGVAR